MPGMKMEAMVSSRAMMATISATLAASMLASTAMADLIINSETGEILDVTHAVGAGANASYVIIDFEATAGGVYAFAFHWDSPLGGATPLTGFDMLLALAAATNLTVDYTDSSFGPFINNFAFDDDAGDADFFWSFSVGEVIDPGVSWTGSPIGMADRELYDGSLDGWYNGFTDSFDAIPPGVPTTFIPTPSALAAMLIASALGSHRARRRE